MTMEVSKVLHLPRKIEGHPLKTMQKSCACLSHRTTFDTWWNTFECHEEPRSWHEVTQRLGPPTVTPQRHGHSAIVANGCRRLRTVADGRRLPPPDPQSKTRTLRHAFGKKQDREQMNTGNKKSVEQRRVEKRAQRSRKTKGKRKVKKGVGQEQSRVEYSRARQSRMENTKGRAKKPRAEKSREE